MVTNARGIAFLLPKNKSFKIVNFKNILEGRIASLVVNVDDSTISLINIYFPTKDKQPDQLSAIGNLDEYLQLCNSDAYIIGGDFNLYLNPVLDKYNGKETDLSQASKTLRNVLVEHSLIDIWRTKNPYNKRYTWRRSNPLTQARLDYWLISIALTYNVTKCDIKPTIKSDHSIISLTLLRNTNKKKGPGLWKFNAALLQNNEYVEMLKNKLTFWNSKYKDITNENTKWDLIKSLIRIESKNFSKKLAKKKKDYENELYEQLQRVTMKLDEHQTESLLVEYKTIQNRLDIINREKAQGVKIRAKVDWVADSERCTAYFLNLEKEHGKQTTINRLVEKGQDLSTHGEILDALKGFYGDLYSRDKNLDQRNYKHFLNDKIPKINPDSVSICEQPISYKEINSAIKNLKMNKSPGTDGLTAEFYMFFHKDIKQNLYDCINYSFQNKILSIEQRRGVLKLIPKKDKDLTNMRSFRPITLLNTDYKIITHILASRLQKVLPEIISSDQNGYLKGRFIGHNIRTILDTIQYTSQKDQQAYLLFLDFEKAFDKLDHKFLINALYSFGFGNNFIQWIQILYTDIQSCVLNNGFTSQYFQIMAGIRQGCPISALLFIVAAECLAIYIKVKRSIKGINVGGKERKITQLADDTTLFLRDIGSIQNTLYGLSLFYSVSGLIVNKSKTMVLPIGKNCNIPKNSLFDLQWNCTDEWRDSLYCKKNYDLKFENF